MVKSGAVRPITGSITVGFPPPKALPGPRRSPAPMSVCAPRRGKLLAVNRRHRQRALEILLDHRPVEVVEERLDVLGARATVIDPVGVLVYVEGQDRRRVPQPEG